MRETRLFRKLLGLASCVVEWVKWKEATEEEAAHLVIRIRPTWRRLRCGNCGRKTSRKHGGAKVRRWRDLSPWGMPVLLEGQVQRVVCGRCGVRTSSVPWARPGSRFTRRFENEVAWMLQRADQTAVSQYFGISWVTTGRIARRVVGEYRQGKPVAGAFLGVDEISYGRPRKFLTVVVDHESSRVVWAAEGKNAKTLRSYFEELSEADRKAIEVVSIDMSAAFRKAIHEALPDAVIVYDRFHVMQLLSAAIDECRREEMRRCKDPEAKRRLKGYRWALLRNEWNLTLRDQQRLAELRRLNDKLYRARLLRDAFQVIFAARTAAEADERFHQWRQWALRSRLAPFVKLARTIEEHWDGIRRFIELRITNAPVEGYNSKIRMISHRAFGFHTGEALIAMIQLNCSGIELTPLGHSSVAKMAA